MPVPLSQLDRLGQIRQLQRLPDEGNRLDALLGAVRSGTVSQSVALELATSFGLQGQMRARLTELGVAGYGRDQGPASTTCTPLGADTVFMMRLRGATAQLGATRSHNAGQADAVQEIHSVLSRHEDYLQTFSDTEWAELISTCNLFQRTDRDPLQLRLHVGNLIEGLEANDSILKMHGSMRRYHIPRKRYLQHVRRNNLKSLMGTGEFGAIYRYSRDHDINSLLREYWGKENIPGHLQAAPRRDLLPEQLNPHMRNSPVSNNVVRPYTPVNNITTGHFIYELDVGLRHLKEIQGHEPRRLYRATMFSQKWIDDLIESGRFQDHGFTSTSKEPTKLNDFFNWQGTRHYQDERATLFYFETDRGVDISHVSKFDNETEHLIPRGEVFAACFLGYRRDLCPGLNTPEHENWAVFALTDDGHAIGNDALENLRRVLRSQ